VVNFANRNTPDSLPPDVSLSLFRVVQEALRNAIKYSGQKDFEVHLQGTPGGLELQVMDRGIGFDVGSVRNAGGLGLISMRERIQSVNGAIQVDSKPNGGTRIRVHVPFGIKSNDLTRDSNLLGHGFQSNP
jgi:signal transduction histidine kinase